MVIKFELRSDRPDAAGRCQIHLRAYFDGQRLRLSTAERCASRHWDAAAGKVLRSYGGSYQDVNETLKAQAARVESAYRHLRIAGLRATPQTLRETLGKLYPEVFGEAPALPVAQVLPLVAQFDAFREVQRGRGMMWNTLRHYLVTRNWLAAYERHSGRQLQVASYDVVTHDEVLRFLRLTLQLAPNSIYTLAKNLRRFFRYLRDELGQSLAVEPARLGVRSQETQMLHLTAEELEALRVALLPATLVPVRDVFLFCCYTGLRYSDVLQLHGGNVVETASGRVLRLTQTKTRTAVSIYLTSAAAAILARYAGPERSGPGARLLPVLANQVMNRYLKRVAQLAGLTRTVEVVDTRGGVVRKEAVLAAELVTMHTARHTFAVQSLVRGMPVAVLQRVMGHANITTTMSYAKVVEDFQHAEMRRVWEGAVVATTETAVVCGVELAA